MNYNRANGFSGIGKFLLSDKTISEDSLNFNIIDYTTPRLSLVSIDLMYRGENSAIPGDLTIDTEVKLKFIVDENLDVYFTLYTLMLKYAQEKTSDTFTLKLTDNKHKVIAQMNYYNCFISELSELSYSTTNDETTTYIDVSLSYSKFTPQRV